MELPGVYGMGKMRFPGICLKCGQPMKAGDMAYFLKVGRCKKTAHTGCSPENPVADCSSIKTDDPLLLEILRLFKDSILISIKKTGVPLDLEYDGSMLFHIDKHITKER